MYGLEPCLPGALSAACLPIDCFSVLVDAAPVAITGEGTGSKRHYGRSTSGTIGAFQRVDDGAAMSRGKERKMIPEKTNRIVVIVLGLGLVCAVGCTSSASSSKAKGKPEGTEVVKAADRPQAEARSAESKSVDPAVQSELERMAAEKRAALLQDARSALEETRNALSALDKGDSKSALAALGRVTGKLDLVVARDPQMALAPVSVDTAIFDLYTTLDTIKAVVSQAKDDLSGNRVQHARHLVSDLASEADFHVTEIPLATYPPLIRAVAPLIDAGKTEEAKAALNAALNTLVVETYVVPLPKVRAEAMIAAADSLARQTGRNQEDNNRLSALLGATRHEIQLAETLGYGTRDSYKALYTQMDEIEKKTEHGQSGKGIFEKLRNSLKSFKFAG